VVIKGSHTIIVTDDQTAKTFTFVMEGTPPQAPTLATPATGIKSKQPIIFTWGAVTDQSNPVTYKLEVATDANFTNIVISHDGLTTTSYTTTAAEKLPTVSKKAPYYWRVTATDAASNVGQPSTASTFVVGFAWADVPVWVWITGVVFVVVIAGGVTYLLTRRRSRF
jgi:phosphodiesterase/alkaline phosphatase D-like protein